MNEITDYYYSIAVSELVSKKQMDNMVVEALKKYEDRNVKLEENDMYCCRFKLKEINEIVVFVLFRKSKDLYTKHLFTWQEAKEKNIDKDILKIVGKEE